MKIIWAKTEFVLAAPDCTQVPCNGLPQLAVAGHSNVGKSSLLNTLLERKTLMRTSKRPGCTRLLNVFDVDQQLTLVDLPGYGFAKASKKEQGKWQRLIESYLLDKSCPKRLVLVLLDARHGPKPSDLELIDWLNEEGIRWHPVATKTDKLNARLRDRRRNEMRDALGGMLSPLWTSSLKKSGVAELRALVMKELFDSKSSH